MSEPEVIGSRVLAGTRIALSVSESADLMRLGLSEAHCELAIAELAQAIFIAGGTIVYGGQLVGRSFTDVLLDELRRYRSDRDALILCVPETEHRKLSDAELVRRYNELHLSADLICLDAGGQPIDVHKRKSSSETTEVATALSAMRRYVTANTDARVLVGGKLAGYQGSMPGVIEEAIMSVEARQPLYVAGGFGGAALAASQRMHDLSTWVPADLPRDIEGAADALTQLRDAIVNTGHVPDGLDEYQHAQLAATHRPGDIASLTVTGLSALLRSRRNIDREE